MSAEYARVEEEELTRLKPRKMLTLLFDGWEDKLRRSLYGSVAAEVGQLPTILSLDDMTGKRGSADKYVETAKSALRNMGIEDATNFLALTTDNPTVMVSFSTKFQIFFPWILVSSRIADV
jgi:hypothetical protein